MLTIKKERLGKTLFFAPLVSLAIPLSFWLTFKILGTPIELFDWSSLFVASLFFGLGMLCSLFI